MSNHAASRKHYYTVLLDRPEAGGLLRYKMFRY